MITISFREGEQTQRSHDPQQLAALLQNGSHPFWLDLEAPTPEELRLLDESFHFHPLTVEALSDPTPPYRVSEYEGYAFFGLDVVEHPSACPEPAAGQQRELTTVTARRVSLYFNGTYLVTVHQQPVETLQQLREVCLQNRRALDRGVDFLLYTLLDMVVDAYFPLLDDIEDCVDALEDRIVTNPPPGILEEVFTMKRELMRLRKYIAPTRETLQALTTRAFPGIRSKTLPYLREVDDHLFRIYENLDTYRDQMSNLLDAYLSQVNNEMNRVMQRLTAVSIIFLPLTFMTGFFGMNFDKMPWSGTSPLLWLGVMVGISIGALWFLTRRKWV